jgi:hypothetical protein
MRTRRHLENFDDLAVLSGATTHYRMSRSNEESRRIAGGITDVIGAKVGIIERYLDELSYAPPEHLRLLVHRGTRIVFAPTIDAALISSWADRRRNRTLSMSETKDIRVNYGPESNAVGIYDPETDALIFPTAYSTSDLRGVVLHELGHALTMPRATIRPALIQGLPRQIERHVYAEHYRAKTAEQTLEQRVHEALAEGYIEIIEGRGDHLPRGLTSELMFMLSTMEDGPRVRFEFERTENGNRTASRASDSEIVDGGDPTYGHLYAPYRLDPDASDWQLDEDELAARRSRDAAA